MAKVEKDPVTGMDTTGHEWDGIKELNTPLPRWWLYVLYACIVWAVGYWIAMPSWPMPGGPLHGLLGFSSRADVQNDMDAAKAKRAQYLVRFEQASLQEIKGSKELLNFALAGGRAMFNENCAACHTSAGTGGKGYPNLADDDWLWGGDIDSIKTTISHGIRSPTDPDTRVSDMPRFGADKILTPPQIEAVADFVLAMSKTGTDAAPAAEQGKAIYAENCAACHGEKGEGNIAVGAPTLNDHIWLYGGDKKTVVETITNARRGVMPAWSGRLDDATVKMLAVYVHSLGGGK